MKNLNDCTKALIAGDHGLVDKIRNVPITIALKIFWCLAILNLGAGASVNAQCGLTISPQVDSFGCIKAIEEAVWTDAENVSVAGNNLTKTSGGTNWNAGAFSTAYVANFGYAETVVSETNSERAFGLSHQGAGFGSNAIQFSFRLRTNGSLAVVESGSTRANSGSYQTGDTLRVAVENNTVTYYRNNAVLYVSNFTPSLPLNVHAAIRNAGGTIQNVRIGNFSNGDFAASTTQDLTGLGASWQWYVNNVAAGLNAPSFNPEGLTPGDVVTCMLSTNSGCASGGTISNEIEIQLADDFSPGNFYITSVNAESACNTATEDVKWNNNALINVKASNNNLVKIQGGTNWNANASSLNALSGNGTFQFTTNENNRQKAAGLSNMDINAHYNTIEYCFEMRDNGTLRIFESGTNRGDFGLYSAGDTLTIAVENGTVSYKRNNQVLYISNVAPSMPLIADVSIRQVNATIVDASITNLNDGQFTAIAENAGANPSYQWKVNGVNDGDNSPNYTNTSLSAGDEVTCELSPDLGSCDALYFISNAIVQDELPEAAALNFFITGTIAESACNTAIEEVQWDANTVSNILVNGTHLTKIQGGTSWNANAASLNNVSDNGSFLFSTNESNLMKAVGLSSADINASFNTIEYCFYLESNATVRIYESGINRGSFGTYAAGDQFEIKVENGVVKYFRNGSLIRISNVAPSLPLLADVSIRQVNATVTDARITNLNGGAFTANVNNAGDSPTFQWKLNGVNVGDNSNSYTNAELENNDVVMCELTPDLGGCNNTTYSSNAITQNIVPDPSAINFFITGIIAESACYTATEEVQWNAGELVNVSANGNNLVKLQGGTNWNGGAFSSNSVADNGTFSFSTAESNLTKAAGLSSTNLNNNQNSIDYCFLMESNGSLRIFELGTNRGTFGTYSAGDSLSITLEAGVVKYYRNDDLLRISTVSPTLPLYADVSIRNVGATITKALITNFNGGSFAVNAENAGNNPIFQWKLNDFAIGNNSSTYTNHNLVTGDVLTCELIPDLGGCSSVSYTSNAIFKNEVENPVTISFYISGDESASACYESTEEVQWNPSSLLHVNASGNNLTKVQSSNNWNGNASSFNTVRDNGALSFSTAESNRAKAIGLSSSDINSNFNSIDYAFYMESNGNLRIFESGNNRGNFGTYAAGDSMSIAVESGVVKYYRNGSLLRISATAPSLPLMADVSLYSLNSTITNAKITNLNGGAFTANVQDAGDNPSFQWKLNGANVGSNSPNYSYNEFQNGDVVVCELTPELGGCGALTYTSNAIAQSALEQPAAINFFITGTEAASACQSITEEVRWNRNSLLNTESTGSDLVKIQSGNTWNGNASSLNRVYNDGALSFSTAESNRAKAIGLSTTDANSNYTSIRYCFYFESNGNIRIYESGTYHGNFGTYSAGDSLSIAVENGAVKYYRNGTLLRISPTTPTLPLLADVSLYTLNSTISDAKITNLSGGTFTASVDNAGPNPVFQWKSNGNNVGNGGSTYSNPAMVPGEIITCELTPDLGGCGLVTYTSNAIVPNAVPEPAAINFFITGVPSASACHTAIENVQWDVHSLLNVERDANNLVRIQGGSNWNGNASSLNKVSNNGSFSFSTDENNRMKAVGLSTIDANSHHNSIRYSFYLEGNGNLRIFEQGNNRGNFGTYAAGDSLNIAVENGVVKYYRNGNILYISNLVPSLPLLVDVSMYTPMSTITDARISNLNDGTFSANAENAGQSPSYQWKLNGNNVGNGASIYVNANLNDADVVTCEFTPDVDGCQTISYTSNAIEANIQALTADVPFYVQGTYDPSGTIYAAEEVVWNPNSLQNVEANGSNLVKVQSAGNWDGGASSFNTVKDNGYIEFSPAETNRRRVIGLSTNDANANQNSIRYGFHLDGSTLRVIENGATRGSYGTFTSNDVLKIAVEGSVVRYYRNEVLLYSSNLAPTLPLLIDVSIRDIGGTAGNIVVVNRNSGTFAANATGAGNNPSFQWQRNGANVGGNSATYSNSSLFDGDVITCIITPDLQGCSSVSYHSNEITIIGETATTNWTGAINSQWNLPGNWSDGLPNEFRSAYIPAGVPNRAGVNALSQVLNLEIEAGAHLQFIGANTLQIYGDVTNNGIVTPGTGTIVFAGEGSRTVQGNAIQFNRLIVNLELPSDSVILQTNFIIRDEALMLSGVVYTGGNEVIYNNGSESRFGSASSYIDGVCRKIGNEAFTFPVGKNGIYAPVGISAPNSVSDQFTAAYITEDPAESGYNPSQKDAGVVTVSRCEYWNINREVGTSAVSVTLSYENERSCGIGDPSLLKVLRWNGSNWQDHGYLNHDGTVEAGTITSAAAIVNFSPFTLGSGSAINPLPIELVSFAAKAQSESVELTWETASEINNDYFTIERSRDGVNFEHVVSVAGAGNSNTALRYIATDRNPYMGTSYYRLTQTDFDGSSETFPMKSVNLKANFSVEVFPNPSEGQVTVGLRGNFEQATIQVMSLTGQVMHKSNLYGSQQQLDLRHLAPGVYIVQAGFGESTWTQKLVIRR